MSELIRDIPEGVADVGWRLLRFTYYPKISDSANFHHKVSSAAQSRHKAKKIKEVKDS